MHTPRRSRPLAPFSRHVCTDCDPFDGRPLRYAPLKNIVYSIGADLVDRGGSDRENPVSARQDKNEPTFQIEF